MENSGEWPHGKTPDAAVGPFSALSDLSFAKGLHSTLRQKLYSPQSPHETDPFESVVETQDEPREVPKYVFHAPPSPALLECQQLQENFINLQKQWRQLEFHCEEGESPAAQNAALQECQVLQERIQNLVERWQGFALQVARLRDVHGLTNCAEELAESKTRLRESEELQVELRELQQRFQDLHSFTMFAQLCSPVPAQNREWIHGGNTKEGCSEEYSSGSDDMAHMGGLSIGSSGESSRAYASGESSDASYPLSSNCCANASAESSDASCPCSDRCCSEQDSVAHDDIEDAWAKSRLCYELKLSTNWPLKDTAGRQDLPKSQVTTLMICDIPCHKDMAQVIEAIDYHGFEGTYDLVYMSPRPGDHDRLHRRNRGQRFKGGQENIGYAFVTFKNQEYATAFAAAFRNYKFPESSSQKLSYTKLARCQGYDATLKMNMNMFNVPDCLRTFGTRDDGKWSV